MEACRQTDQYETAKRGPEMRLTSDIITAVHRRQSSDESIVALSASSIKVPQMNTL